MYDDAKPLNIHEFMDGFDKSQIDTMLNKHALHMEIGLTSGEVETLPLTAYAIMINDEPLNMLSMNLANI